MDKFYTRQFAANGILIILSLIVVFHLAVIIGLIPFNLVWGGRLTSYSQMLSFETTSIGINLIMLAVVAIYAGIIKVKVNRILLKVILWMMFVLFLVNTVGNLFSNTELEKMIFTPLTLLLALFSLRLAISKGQVPVVEEIEYR